MSNAHLAQRFRESSARRDVEDLRQLIAEDAVWDMTRSRGPYSGLYKGHQEIQSLLESVIDAWDEQRFEVLSSYESGDLLAEEMRAVVRGRGSGVELEARGARVYEFRDGQLVRFVLCQDMQQAKALVDEAQP